MTDVELQKVDVNPTLRVAEVYQSVQGEGPQVGEPTTFVRFGGCNLRCEGWKCDTPYAIYPREYRHEWVRHGVNELIAKIPVYPRNVCLTGGEPFLQNHRALQDLVFLLRQRGQHVEAFTNGTIAYPDWALTSMVDLVIDWKLPGSGEDTFNATRWVNLRQIGDRDSIKFTIKDRADFDQAMINFTTFLDGAGETTQPTFFAGVVWDSIPTSKLVEWMLAEKLPWKLNVQVHNYIWDRSQRGI
jgi:7-carboxy-7-deazaguanine synthase